MVRSSKELLDEIRPLQYIPKRAWLYRRVSKDLKQASPESQLAELRNFVVNHFPKHLPMDEAPGGHSIQDRDVSGETKFQNRPGAGLIWSHAREGDIVVCTESDRFSRSNSDYHATIEGLARRGVKVYLLNLSTEHAVNDFSGDEGPSRELLGSMHAAVNKFHNDMVARKTRRAIRYKMAQGGPTNQWGRLGWMRILAEPVRSYAAYAVKEIRPDIPLQDAYVELWQRAGRPYADIQGRKDHVKDVRFLDNTSTTWGTWKYLIEYMRTLGFHGLERTYYTHDNWRLEYFHPLRQRKGETKKHATRRLSKAIKDRLCYYGAFVVAGREEEAFTVEGWLNPPTV